MKTKKTCYLAFLVMVSILTSIPLVVSASSVSSLNKTKTTIWVGESVKLKVLNNSKSVHWQSSNQKVAVVSDNGIVRGKGAGKATISAKIGTKKYNCAVNVKDKKIKSIRAKSNFQKSNTQISFVFSDNSVIKKIVDYASWGLEDDQIVEHYELVDLTGDGKKELVVSRCYPNNVADTWLLVDVFLMKDGNLKELSYEADISELKGQAYSGKVVSLNEKGYPRYGLELECYSRYDDGAKRGQVYIENQYTIGYKNNKWMIIRSL